MATAVADESWETRFKKALVEYESGRYREVRGDLEALVIEAEGFDDQGMRRASAMSVLGDVQLSTHRFSEAEELYGRTLKVQSDAMGFENPVVALTLYKLGDTYAKMGRLDLAEPAVRYASSILENLQPPYGHLGLRIQMLTRLAAFRQNLGMPEACVEILERALALADIDPSGNPSIRLFILQSLAQVFLELRALGRARGVLERILGIAEEGENPIQIADTLSMLALIDLATEQAASAASTLERAADLYRQSDDALPSRVRALRGLAGARALLDDARAADAALRDAEHLLKAMFGKKSEEVAELLLQRGRIAARSDTRKALKLLAQALDMRVALLGEGEASAEIVHAMALVQLEAGNAERAVETAERGLSTLESTAPQSAFVAPCLDVIGRARMALGDAEGAIAALEQGRAALAQADAPDPELRAELLEALGNSYQAADRFDEAVAAWDAAVAVRSTGVARDHERRVRLLYRIAEVNVLTDRPVAAARNLQRAGRILSEAPAPSAGLAGLVAWQLARVLQSLGDVASVEALYTEAVAFLEEALGPEHADVAQCRRDLEAFRAAHAGEVAP